MRSLPAQKAAWCAAYGIVLFALGVVPTELSIRQAVLTAQTQAPCEEGAACVPASWVFLAAPAPEDPFSPPPVITADASLRLPVSEAPSFPVTVPVPPLNAKENTEHALESGGDDHKAFEADASAQDMHLAGLLKRQKTHEQGLAEHDRAIAMFTHGQEQLTNTLDALQKDADKKVPQTASAKMIALTVGGVFTVVTLSAFLFRGTLRRPSHPVLMPETVGQNLSYVAPPTHSHKENARMHLRIATRYLSTPKQEDVILADFAPQRYTLVLADGASSYQGSGGECSGGGRQAAEIAAHTALTYLGCNLCPPMCLDGMLSALHDCFAAANASLERHNGHATTPGGTTLLIALLCQAGDGRWYWLYGNVGNGVMSLVHAEPLLAGWPIHTPLLSKQANGVTTITLPGIATSGYRPALGIRPHSPGDMLVIGSDGLDHLDTVTKKSDRLSFPNYLWKQIHDECASLDMRLNALQQGRTDANWQNALALDDTTIGILWA